MSRLGGGGVGYSASVLREIGNYGKVELANDREGTHGTSRLACCQESGPAAPLDTWAVVERDRPGSRQCPG